MFDFQDIFFTINGVIFIWIVKPIATAFICLNYYFCYFVLYLIESFLKLLIKCNNRDPFRSICQSYIDSLPKPHKDVYRQATDIIVASGYHFEIHEVVTDDNYILKAWRIFKEPQLNYPYPIILQHGLLDCSWSWFLNDSKKLTLPYILADQGYDVWITNNRGNKYSIGHCHIPNPAYNKKYWDYGFDEIAKYDIKANVLHVKKITQREKVIYLGHSQGTSQLFAHLTLHPTFQNHIKCFIAFGPALFISNLTIIRFYMFDMLLWIGLPSFFVFDDAMNMKIGSLCYTMSFVYQYCLFAVVNKLCGYPDKNKIDLKRFGVMVSHEPGGSSTKNIVHWLQFYRRKDFCMYDYGKKENMKRYQSENPPSYDVSQLKKFTVPKYLYVGEKDVIADEVDVQTMLNCFPKESTHCEFIKDYHHLDYVWSVDAHLKLYPKVLENIRENQKQK